MSGSQVRLTAASPESFHPHALHDAARTYPETNCYADVLIDLLHACDREPLAVCAHIVRMDFEGDQWTFFKPPPEDLEALLGVDIHEMQPYRFLPAQIAGQLERGRTVIVELDSWYLPDTATTSYRREHVKTSVAAHAIDPDAETFEYFHGIGLHRLEGEDFRGVFRVGEFSADVLPPYTELVRLDAGPALTGAELRAASRSSLARHLRARPAENPFAAFGAALERDLPELLAADLATYHDYAFATVRMAGAGFEVLGDYARWVLGDGGADAATACAEIVDGCKALSFRLARRRTFDPAPAIGRMAEAWERAIAELERAVS